MFLTPNQNFRDLNKLQEGIGEKIGDIFGKKKKKGSNP